MFCFVLSVTLFFQASELFEKLCQVNLDEIRQSNELANAWEKNWIDPVLAVLCGKNHVQKVNVLEVTKLI